MILWILILFFLLLLVVSLDQVCSTMQMMELLDQDIDPDKLKNI